MLPPTGTAAATAGFVVKLFAPKDKTRHYINLCSHSAIDRPIDGRDKEVDDSVLRTRGIDNLRVPLLTSAVRTVALAGGDEEAVCFDVVFNPAVLAVALPGGDKQNANSAAAANGIDPALSKFVRVRLIELALTNAERELGYKLGRDYTLPKSATYKGGIGGGNKPVPCGELRQFIARKEAAAQQSQQHEAPGPWSSKRAAAGKTTRGKIEELDSFEDGDKASAPLLKKGFFSSAAKKGKELYPEGSSEGMLYGDVKTAGDPLGYLPKGLRNRVHVVDPSTTTEEQQQKMMEDYATGKKKPAAGGVNGGAAPASATAGKAADAGAGNLAKGFLNGKQLYPDRSSEGDQPSEHDALKELMGSKSDWDELANSTDPDTFLSELGQMGAMLGLDGAGGGMGGLMKSMPPMPPKDVQGGESVRKYYETAAATGAAPASAERAPEHELVDAGVDQAVVLKVKLPELESLADAEVDISEERFRFFAAGAYKLELVWPRPMAADDAKAKFTKKSRTLTVTVPPACV